LSNKKARTPRFEQQPHQKQIENTVNQRPQQPQLNYNKNENRDEQHLAEPPHHNRETTNNHHTTDPRPALALDTMLGFDTHREKTQNREENREGNESMY
jgi:hypothetical protein